MIRSSLLTAVALCFLTSCSSSSGDGTQAVAGTGGGAGGAAGAGGTSAASGNGGAGGNVVTVDITEPIGIFVTNDVQSSVVTFTDGIDGVQIVETDDPSTAVDHGAGQVRIALVQDLTCTECYRIDGSAGRYRVHGGDLLGLHYGLAQTFELLGYRFFHPKQIHAPTTLSTIDGSPLLGQMNTPEQTLRGIHLHTIHPIESYFDFWESSDAGFAEAKRVIDWTVKNRGNFIEWVALDNIESSPDVLAAWQAHTAKIIAEAHARGVQVGIGIQLFATSSLQRGFSLVKSASMPDTEDTIRSQLTLLLTGLAFDQINLSFGEFSGTNAQTFIDDVNLVQTVLAEISPTTRLDATVHMGNYPSLQVPYMGQNYLYYFLVQFCDPRIVPWVHSVMYFDLYEDAGGAYGYDDFSQHRQFILDALAAQKPVGYFPESAYWVDFDDSVPTYLPLYMRSRFLDIQQLRASAMAQGSPDVKEHVEFSSGWEWGYWQQDSATLRMGYSLPATWDAPVKDMFVPYGPPGAILAEQTRILGEAEHDGLIGKRLAAYLAGRDMLLDAGAANGIVSEPTRPSFDDIAAMSSADRATFRMNVVEPLKTLSDASAAARDAAIASGADATDPFVAEILDGFAITAARARFAYDVWGAVANQADNGNDGGLLADADATVTEAQTVVTRRHQNLHDGPGDRLTGTSVNSTIYAYGYLYMADSICFWRRERAQAGNTVAKASADVPSCGQ